jgi:hypothetical protein
MSEPQRGSTSMPSAGRSVLALALSLLGLASIGLGVLTMVTPLPQAAAASSATTVPWKHDGIDGSFTVSQTSGLVYQSVHLSWTGGFPRTSLDGGDVSNPLNAIVFMQCRGTNPTRDDCYFFNRQYTSEDPNSDGTTQFRDEQGNVEDPTKLNPSSNEVYGITNANGSGSATMELRTSTQLPALGCTRKTDGQGVEVPACSLVVVPVLGFLDGTIQEDPALDAFSYYNWNDRAVVPLSFAPTLSSCTVRNPDVAVEGGEALQRAMEAWQPKLCTQTNRVDVAYNRNGEPQARDLFQSGAADAALTIRPLAGSERKRTYAPLATSGFGVGFLIDDVNGQQITDLKLNARLLAKVLTQSYGPVGNSATKGNPGTIGADPELLALNPGLNLPINITSMANPIQLGVSTDLLWDLTRWISSDKDARDFLAGKPDPWKMHVNTHYKGIKLPEDTLQLRDDLAATQASCRYSPMQDLYPTVSSSGDAATAVIGRTNLVRQPPILSQDGTNTCQQSATSPFPVGIRMLLGLMDTSDAAPLNIPMAKLENSKGKFVGPTPAAISSAVKTMVTGSDKITKSVDFAKLPADAYPLTHVTYAAVPTTGLTTAKANALGTFLDLAAGPGQVQGAELGNLPPGYVPLTSAMKAQTKAAANAVRKAASKPGPKDPAPKDPGSNPGSGGGSGPGSNGTGAGPGTDATGATSPANGKPATTNAQKTPTVPVVAPAHYNLAQRGRPTVASSLRYVLPILLGIGLLAGGASLAFREMGRPRSVLKAMLSRVPGR